MPLGIAMANASKCFTFIVSRNGQKPRELTKMDKQDGDVLDANSYENHLQGSIFAFAENAWIHPLKEDAKRPTVAAKLVENRSKLAQVNAFTNALNFVIQDLVHLVPPMSSSKYSLQSRIVQ